jgi:hypothetical protein
MNFRADQFRITSRIHAGFGALIILGAVLAGLGAWGISSAGGELKRLAEVSSETTRILDLGRLLERLRVAALHYKDAGDEASLSAYTAADADAAGLLSTLAKASSTQDRARVYSGLDASLGALRGKFKELLETGRAYQETSAAITGAGKGLVAATDRLVEKAQDTNHP